jgi:hypothetical protein
VTSRRRSATPPASPPLPLEPIDLLAGLAPGVDLLPDGSLAATGAAAGEDGGVDAGVTVAELGRMLRSGDATIRRLIRTPVLRPAPARPGGEAARGSVDIDRAGVPPRTRERPGE